MGKYPAALTCFQEALALFPESVHVLPAVAFSHDQISDTNGFNEVLQKISDLGASDDYFMICRNALLGNILTAKKSLMRMAEQGQIYRHFIRRDPNLQFLFGSSAQVVVPPT
jgi:hypothetical protein